jgi:hypothetical protein
MNYDHLLVSVFYEPSSVLHLFTKLISHTAFSRNHVVHENPQVSKAPFTYYECPAPSSLCDSVDVLNGYPVGCVELNDAWEKLLEEK